MLLKRQPIERLLNDPQLDPELESRLRLVLEVREFAQLELQLPVGKSYRSYVELGRPYVTWNVVAAPAHSMVPKTWCFPIAGCVSYRGYFSEHRAHRFAEALREDGWDVSVGGVTAYSTLGWFADPVLDTFVDLPDLSLAGLLFHEIAHQKLYVPGDTAFNESFASHVELIGERLFSERRGEADHSTDAVALRAAAVAREREGQFIDLVLSTQTCLDRLYRSGASDEVLELGKAQEFDQLRALYGRLRAEWVAADKAGPVYDGWFDRALNNAHIAAVGDYSIWLEAFAELELRSQSLEAFYQAAADLAALDPTERKRQLEELSPARSAPTDRSEEDNNTQAACVTAPLASE